MEYIENLPLKDVVTGKNPRTYFSQSELDDLCQSIKSLGVIQPIIVTEIVDPTGEKKYKITAGERRFRASVMAYGLENGTIPAIVRTNDTETTTREVAMTENIQRQAMSPTEESDAAAKILSDLNGDKEETMRRLGWKSAMLNARLALQNLTPAVKQALNERRILLGHAELLAVIASANQDSALNTILEHKLTVAQTKEKLTQVSQKLNSALFDKTQCQTCVSNSEVQATLLETSVGDGYCTNRECFAAKTNEHIELLATQLREELPRVEVLREFHGIKINTVTDQSVGQEQFNACKGCASFGATVSLQPSSTGKVTKNQCFDAACNSEMVTAHALALAKASQVEPPEKNPGTEVAPVTATSPKKVKASSDQPTRKTVNQRAIDFKQNTWRKIVANELFADTHKASIILLSLMYTGSMRHYQSSNVKKLSTKLFGFDRGDHEITDITLSDFTTLEKDKRESGTNAAIASLMLTIPISEVFQIAQFYQFDLMKHWQISKEYLELFTKSELESMCCESGLNTFFGTDTDFKKALGLKKTELIEAVLALKVNWKEVTPSAMALEHTRITKHQAKQPDAPEIKAVISKSSGQAEQPERSMEKEQV